MGQIPGSRRERYSAHAPPFASTNPRGRIGSSCSTMIAYIPPKGELLGSLTEPVAIIEAADPAKHALQA